MFINRSKDAEFMKEYDRNLPVYKYRPDILKYVSKNDSVIIMSETGSGKSTKIPRFLLKISGDKKIVCTQPRRIAAISLAKRVAEEMSSSPGKVVGYMVRFDNKSSDSSKIIYATDGALLRESIEDTLLESYSIVILDEAHERSLHTDILFGVVKRAQEMRKSRNLDPLKIVIMSATININKFSSYFNAVVLPIEGRRYPVKTFYAKQKYSVDHIDLSYSTIIKLHATYPTNYDFLVFLSGQDEILFLKSVLDQEFPDMSVYALFAALPMNLQLSMFTPNPKTRRVILSTNIAETSLTIPGVKVVIDSGYVKQKSFNPSTHIVSLKSKLISKTEARQRAGRVGRTESGFCYRLYTENTYHEEFTQDPIPELLRCSLSSVFLTLLASGIENPKSFDWIDVPQDSHIESSWAELMDLRAVKLRSSYRLTKYGKMMAKLPVNPRFSKALILASKVYSCSVEIAIIIALLSEQNIFYNPKNSEGISFNGKKEFISCYGDVLTLLNVFRTYKIVSGSYSKKELKKWCNDHNLNLKSLSNASKIQRQLYTKMNTLGLPILSAVSTYHDSIKESEAILTCLLCGFFDYTVYYNSLERVYKTLLHHERVFIHPSSIFHKSRHKFLFFTEKIHTSNNFIRNLSVFSESYLKSLKLPRSIKEKLLEAFNSLDKASQASVVYN